MGLRKRFRIVDFQRVLELLGGIGAVEFRQHYVALIDEGIAKDQLKREAQWTETIAVGSETFVYQVAEETRGRQQLRIEGAGETWSLKEPTMSYTGFSDPKTKCKRLRDR